MSKMSEMAMGTDEARYEEQLQNDIARGETEYRLGLLGEHLPSDDQTVPVVEQDGPDMYGGVYDGALMEDEWSTPPIEVGTSAEAEGMVHMVVMDSVLGRDITTHATREQAMVAFDRWMVTADTAEAIDTITRVVTYRMIPASSVELYV